MIPHLLVLALTIAWLSLTGLKIVEYLSEPTATKISWERGSYLPPFTICPTVRTTSLEEGNDPDRENDTLLKLFRDLSLRPEDMLQSVFDNSSEFTLCRNFGCVDFKTSVDYLEGGTCLTSKAADILSFDLTLMTNPLYENPYTDNPIAYDFVFHGHPEFIGDVYLQDPTYYLSAAQRGIHVTVTIDRQIEVNLRRDPCTDDPTYSKRLCERQCFFDWLKCSMHGDDDTNKPRCMASDADWYKRAGPLDTFFDAPDGVGACPCPKPCVSDVISITVQSDPRHDDTFISVHMTPARMTKVLKTYVTYTFSDLMADTGGFLGLFLGWSLLSVCHLLPKWLCSKRGGQDPAMTGRRVSREARRTRPSPSPVPLHSAHRGDAVLRVSPSSDRPTY